MSSSMILEMCASSSSVSLAALDFGSAIAFDHVYKGCQSILEWSDSQPEDMQTQTSTFVPSVPASVNINIELPQECPPSLCPHRIERGLRKTIDERSKRRIDAHRVLFEENRKLRLELSSLQDVLRSSRQTNDGDADASVAALEKERDARLQIEARMHRTVDTLRTEIAQLSEAKTVAEEAHRNAQRDAAYGREGC
ncbi:hypothetical protein A0H81_04372 [Grifola frondosa]|uniref:Uncharacterized protein n=1 Tax=Grifola frondosa TaxID=5627 RepID=A0A1C7MGB4_GRIFR|nr:hypothetical protein A0H81_04372 [Grifola frondosa]